MIVGRGRRLVEKNYFCVADLQALVAPLQGQTKGLEMAMVMGAWVCLHQGRRAVGMGRESAGWLQAAEICETMHLRWSLRSFARGWLLAP